MIYLKFYFVLIIIPFTLSSLCTVSDFNLVLSNIQSEYEIGPNIETCLEYPLVPNTNQISFVFSEINSTTAEVILYKSKSDISLKDNSYQNYYERFLISENSFKEINLKNFEEKMYIIIRD